MGPVPPSISVWIFEKKQVRRLRRQAYAAVGLGRPFGKGQSSHAELALLRALTLERELRRASLLRSRESVAAMTRGVIESVLRGLYVLIDSEEAHDRLVTEAMRHLRKFSFFGDAAPAAAFTSLGDVYGGDFERGMPDLRKVAETVDAHYDMRIFTGQQLGAYLYHDWYLPLSNLSVHPSGAALSRYYRFRSSDVTKRPWQVIPRRGAIRAADGAIAFLLSAILKSRDEEVPWLQPYAERQIAKANIPMAILLMRVTLGQGPRILARTAYTLIRHRVAFDVGAPLERRLSAMQAVLRAATPNESDAVIKKRATGLIGAVDAVSDVTA